MSNYIVTDIELTSIANTIRTKGKTSSSLTFPTGFMSAITNLSGYTNEDKFIEGTFGSTYTNSRVKTIGSYAFYSCSSLRTVDFSACTKIGTGAFGYCTSLSSISFPVCTYIGERAFGNCNSLKTISFPVCKHIGDSAFQGCGLLSSISFPSCTIIYYMAFGNCASLKTANFPFCTTIESSAFTGCTSLSTLYIDRCNTIQNNAFRGCVRLVSLYLFSVTSVPHLQENVFYSTPIGGYTNVAGKYGSVYVPGSLYTKFKSATNWKSIASRIVSV